MAKPRDKAQALANREKIAELLLMGWPQNQIAQYLEIHPSTVCRDVKRIQKQWQTRSLESYQMYLNQELDKLSLMERQAYLAWLKSQQQEVTMIQEEGDDRQRRVRKTVTQVGNPAFLNTLLQIHDRKAKLLGLGVHQSASSFQQEESSPHVIVVPQEMTWEEWAERYGQEEQPDMQTIEAQVQAMIDAVPPVKIPEWPASLPS